MGFPLRTNSGSTQNLWGMRDYGFRGLWDKRASTVVPSRNTAMTGVSENFDLKSYTAVSRPRTRVQTSTFTQSHENGDEGKIRKV